VEPRAAGNAGQVEPSAAARTLCSPRSSLNWFSGPVDGYLRAYSTATGRVLWDADTAREFPTVNGKPAHSGSLDPAGPPW
jgi:polyvinyl alcohol dehydrogenase (cytochrome)